MFSQLSPLVAAVSALLPGIIIGYLIRQLLSSKRISSAESKAEAILNESKSKSQDILLEAKNKALAILEDAKKEEKERNVQLSRIENLLTKKESELELRAKELIEEKEIFKAKTAELNVIKTELEQAKLRQFGELEKLSGFSRERARSEMLSRVEEEYKEDLYKQLKRLEQENGEELDKKAREILTTAIQRYAASHIADVTTTVDRKSVV